MAKTLKVYGWTDRRQDCPKAANGSRYARQIVASTSKARASRDLGIRVKDLVARDLSDAQCLCKRFKGPKAH